MNEDYGRPVHPFCDVFPLIDANGMAALTADIEANGLLNPIVLHDRQVVDGRNRLRACEQANVEPIFVEWREIYKGEQSLADWIWSTNAERRHLTADQLVAAAVKQESGKRDEARQKQIEAGRQQGERGVEGGRGIKKPVVTDSSQKVLKPPRAPAVRTQIAARINASEHKVQQALNVDRQDPDLLNEVVGGTVKLLEAVKRIERPVDRQGVRQFNASRAVKRIVLAVRRQLRKCPSDQVSRVTVGVIRALRHTKKSPSVYTGEAQVIDAPVSPVRDDVASSSERGDAQMEAQ